jgi:RNA polymerase sigma-70 factor, ECF subfamily
MTPASSEVTRYLLAWREGDREALGHLMPLVYDELRRIAAGHLRRERHAHTLQPTALVNEAYLRLAGQTHADWRNRAQFFAVAAQLMRRILVDHARERLAGRRGGGWTRLSLAEADRAAGESELDILALDEALGDLAAFAPRQSRVVELRYFAGLEMKEAAAALGLSEATVTRDWRAAKAWLYRQLNRK